MNKENTDRRNEEFNAVSSERAANRLWFGLKAAARSVGKHFVCCRKSCSGILISKKCADLDPEVHDLRISFSQWFPLVVSVIILTVYLSSSVQPERCN